MSNFNKVITNIPVPLTETEVSNLSQTLSGIVQGGGGGGEGKTYNGDGVYVTVNNDTNPGVINLTQTAKDKLNRPIPSAVADLTDADEYATKSFVAGTYQTIAGMEGYQTKDDMSAYLTKASASQNLAPISVTADIEVLKANSGDFSQYYTKNETYSKTEVYTKEDVYQKTETSSKSELTNAFIGIVTNSELETAIGDVNQTIYLLQDTVAGKQDILTFGKDGTGAISSINSTALAGQGGKTYSAGAGIAIVDEYISLSADYIQAITQVSGKQDELEFTYDTSGSIIKINNSAIAGGAGGGSVSYTGRNGVEINGNYIELETSAKNAIDSVAGIATDVGTLKTASATWDNVSAKLNTTDFNTYTATTAPATYQAKGNYLSSNALEGYATTALLDTISSKIESDIPTTVAQLTDSGNYYTKSETSGKSEITNALNTKLDTTAAAQTYQPLGDYVKNTDISLDANNKITAISGKELIITAHQSLTNYYTKDQTSGATQLSTEFGKYLTKTIADGYYYPLSTNPSNYATSAGLTQSKQYAMTTTGWSEITGGGSTFTGVTTASPITGDGLNNTLGLDSNYKTAIEQVSGKVDKPADMTSNTPYCFSAGQWADITQTYYSKSEASGTFLQKHLTNTLSGDGTTNNTLGVNWSNLSGNTIVSAEKAGEAQGFRWGDNTYQDTSAALNNLWNAKNHVTLQTTNNILTVDNNDNTSATLSAMSYVVNPNNAYWKPQRSCVCTEAEISTMAGYANGQGMLFFVVSGHN